MCRLMWNQNNTGDNTHNSGENGGIITWLGENGGELVGTKQHIFVHQIADSSRRCSDLGRKEGQFDSSAMKHLHREHRHNVGKFTADPLIQHIFPGTFAAGRFKYKFMHSAIYIDYPSSKVIYTTVLTATSLIL